MFHRTPTSSAPAATDALGRPASTDTTETTERVRKSVNGRHDGDPVGARQSALFTIAPESIPIVRALTEHDVADRLGISVRTLRDWRLRKVGPTYYRFGGAVRYLQADLDAFIVASRVVT